MLNSERQRADTNLVNANNKMTMPQFAFEQHKNYFLHSLDQLPSKSAIFDNSRITMLYFELIGLDILDALESLTDQHKKEIVNWVYKLQLVPNENCPEQKCGFMGSTTVINLKTYPKCDKYCESNVGMTYMALCILITLGDDLSRVNKSAILWGVGSLQKSDGSFRSNYENGENDLRFMYCSLAICNILNDWSTINVNNAIQFISKCLNYDGAFGQNPGAESHGGSTYCAIASLSLLESLSLVLDKRKLKVLERWVVNRQFNGGFQGRINKDPDTCYSFWLGATLSIIGSLDRIHKNENINFILNNANLLTGGFSKNMDSVPDLMHTCLSLSGLSLFGDDNLNPIIPALNITVRAANFLKHIQKK
ncbi:Terpenoid cyclases/protein prenyltransferase alpha-alpha toroid,PFTB repeat [Cinara cedri]|uniref:Terpenoid cyclases/protein prenyltransferase alpha-alpha toroid,PFTB repeat n=1 Tax=Cinara cedri TaxID=506608 RepID=A0A5E4MUM9_9HEMI|nr:Terpenoid cyclases/protein prenyltransferase alpha-alpha toroid,PFTB repeat [Cinara cedri]